MIYDLMTANGLAAELGKNMRLSRVAHGLRQEDLARLSGASLQAIKNLESSGKVELRTFLRVAGALGMTSGIFESCEPQPKSLDEIERIEAARTESTRVRMRP